MEKGFHAGYITLLDPGSRVVLEDEPRYRQQHRSTSASTPRLQYDKSGREPRNIAEDAYLKVLGGCSED